MLAITRIRYAPNGEPMGVDLNTVIDLVKLMEAEAPIETIEKVMFLSKELVTKDGN